jgi:butyryl-CoA dehydrogenase
MPAIAATTSEVRTQVLDTVRRFVDREVIPDASKYEHADEYPEPLVARMRDLGLFGATIPEEYGGLGLDYSTYALVVEELCRGWMSLSGVLNTHLMFAFHVGSHGTEAQKAYWLPRLATAEERAGFCLTEAHAGSYTQNIRTVARRDGDHYVVNGSKMFITNAATATVFSLVAKTDPNAEPRHTGISLFAAR